MTQLNSQALAHLPQRDVAPETLRLHAVIKRAAPLGYDRLGRQYWLLGAQENMTVMPLSETHSATQQMTRIDPSVLLKDASGWWGVHNGFKVQDLLDSFSNDITCERNLRENLAERLLFARRKLYSGCLRLKLPQKEWLMRMARAATDVKGFKEPLGLSPEETVKALEVMWAKCIEVGYSFVVI